MTDLQRKAIRQAKALLKTLESIPEFEFGLDYKDLKGGVKIWVWSETIEIEGKYPDGSSTPYRIREEKK